MFEISAIALLVLLVTKELASARDSARMQHVARFLYIPIVPLLAIFVVAAIQIVINIPP